MTPLCLLVPSRGRPDNVARLLSAIAETASWSNVTVLVGVDDDDDVSVIAAYCAAAAPYNDEGECVAVHVLPRHPLGMGGTLNALLAQPTVAQSEVVAFLGDDHLPRTVGWDERILAAVRRLGIGIVYGNDLVQGPKLPTAVFMSARIPLMLGYMAPPGCGHMYLDNWWKDLGAGAGCLEYLPSVVIEHLHPVAGTADLDDGYRRVNAPAVYDRDRIAYERYCEDPAGLRADIAAVVGLAATADARQ